MVPVPSVCVRVPQSSSFDSGNNDSTPSSPLDKHQNFASLVVREFDTSVSNYVKLKVTSVDLHVY